MKIAIAIFLIATFLSGTGCSNWCTAWGDHRLGSNYSLMAGDGPDQNILVYCTSDELCCNVGVELIPQHVSELGFDSDWIVAKTTHGSSNGYWIVEKIDRGFSSLDSAEIARIKERVLGPLEHSQFQELLALKQITLDLSTFEW